MSRSYFQNIDHSIYTSKGSASSFVFGFTTTMILLITSLFSFTAQAGDVCEVKMGYRLTPKIPYISVAPDNTGVYQDWFKNAAEAIGCQLTVIRLPKKRLLQKMRLGEFDFYPNFSRSQERKQYAVFFDLPYQFRLVGLSRTDIPEVKSPQQLVDVVQGRPIVIQGLGGHYGAEFINGSKELQLLEMPSLSVKHGILLLIKGRGDFFVYERDVVNFILKRMSAHERGKIKLHQNCCGVPTPMTIGFAINSPNFSNGIAKQFADALKASQLSLTAY